MAQASLVKLQNQFIISKDVEYTSNEEFRTLVDQSVVVSKLLNGLMKSTRDGKF